jgi:hypothetical protein
MAIQKRSTPEDRAKKLLGNKYKASLRHRNVVPLVRFAKFDASPLNIMRAIEEVRGWKGASYLDKVFVYILCSVMWRGSGESYLTDANFDRLREHLENKEEEILSTNGAVVHGVMLWDERQLRRYNKGGMPLPTIKRTKVRLTPKPKAKPKRRRLKP